MVHRLEQPFDEMAGVGNGARDPRYTTRNSTVRHRSALHSDRTSGYGAVLHGPRTDRSHSAAATHQVRKPILRRGGGGCGGEKAGAKKLYLSNLDYGVTNGDLEILFSELGELKEYSIHYDGNSRSLGTAEVVFVKHSDAVKALKRYNGVKLDGRPLKIEFVGANIVTSHVVSPVTVGVPNNLTGFSGGNEKSTTAGHGLRGNRNAGGFKRTSNQKKGWPKKTAEVLEAELDKYRREGMAMDIN